MTHKYYKNHKSYILLILIFMIGGMNASAKTVIENNVSSSANTGGNSGSENITTGDAKAGSKVETKVSGDGEAKIDAKVEAEANGKKAEAEVHEENPEGDINIRKEVSEDGAKASVDVSIGANSAEMEDDADEEEEADKNENKGFIASIAERVSNTFRNIWEGIGSIFR